MVTVYLPQHERLSPSMQWHEICRSQEVGVEWKWQVKDGLHIFWKGTKSFLCAQLRQHIIAISISFNETNIDAFCDNLKEVSAGWVGWCMEHGWAVRNVRTPHNENLMFMWPCILNMKWFVRPTWCNNYDLLINHSTISLTYFGHHYAHLQERKAVYNSIWFSTLNVLAGSQEAGRQVVCTV